MINYPITFKRRLQFGIYSYSNFHCFLIDSWMCDFSGQHSEKLWNRNITNNSSFEYTPMIWSDKVFRNSNKCGWNKRKIWCKKCVCLTPFGFSLSLFLPLYTILIIFKKLHLNLLRKSRFPLRKLKKSYYYPTEWFSQSLYIGQ